MHDMSVAQMVADEVISKLEGRKPKSISIEMDVGSLRFHDTSQVGFWLKEFLQQEFGKKLKVSADIEKIDPMIKCSCGYEGAVNEHENDHDLMHQGIFTMKCPECRSDGYEITSGNEVILKKINVTE
ncbi:MAG: hydrogenase maturation nickel metallochaperone HypA [Candidatus Aenigmarchaeota archaeon]|nr:hydrogenase maturation nickel metallochaperone HypA [Candidatus Aenigmarchaeota archaeon]